MSDILAKRKYRIEKVPPEGKWGFLIVIGLAMFSSCGLGALVSFGLMFNDFFTSLGAGTSAVTIVYGVYFSAFSFAGYFASMLFKTFSMRSLGICGSLLYVSGSLLTVGVTSVNQLIVTFGILEGAGAGFMVAVAYTIFNHYFVTKRIFMMGIAQALKGVGIMSFPIIVQFLMEKYGFRGAMAIIAAINTHSIFAMLLMHPVEWHLEVKKVPVDEAEPLMNSNDNKNEVKVDVTSEDEFAQTKVKNNSNENLNSTQDTNQINGNEKGNSERSKSREAMDKRKLSTISLADINGNAIVITANGKNGKLKKVFDFLDLSLFKDPIYMNIMLGISFAVYSDNAFFTLLPLYLFELGFTKANAAIVVATGAGADLASRILMAILSLFIHINPRIAYMAAAVGVILVRTFVFLNVTSFVGMLIVVAVLGSLRTWLHATISLIFAEHLTQERFPTAYGLFLFVHGNFAFLIGPLIGWIRDSTKSYIICFNSLSVIMSLCAIPWIVELLWFRFRPRKSVNNNKC